MAIQMDFEYEPDQSGKRRVYRVLAPGLNVRFSGLNSVFAIVDLSAGGMSVRLPNEHEFEIGREDTVTFQIKNKLIAPQLRARTLRLDEGKNIAAFEFVGLDERQVIMLDKLVLALQKHNIKLGM